MASKAGAAGVAAVRTSSLCDVTAVPGDSQAASEPTRRAGTNQDNFVRSKTRKCMASFRGIQRPRPLRGRAARNGAERLVGPAARKYNAVASERAFATL